MLRARWIACAGLLLSGSAEARVPRGAWVVLEVGQVSVKASRPGGGDWDDERLDADRCGLRGTMRRTRPLGEWRAAADALCARFDTKPTSPTGAPPDLHVRLSAGETTEYVSPVAQDVEAHAFASAFLVPLDAIRESGVTLAVLDQDGADAAMSEEIGSIVLSADDVWELARSRTVQSFSGGAVDRLDLSVHRYRPGRRSATARVGGDGDAAVLPLAVIAGEVLEVRSDHADAHAVAGAGLSGFKVGRCARRPVSIDVAADVAASLVLDAM
ncbi:MAG TPA: hypothetical protein VMZ28_09595 [Kofleriaceae bacterium]|nr:hypothetical protein [Kofleriaceae bacterium]